jgi:hypothetical protein
VQFPGEEADGVFQASFGRQGQLLVNSPIQKIESQKRTKNLCRRGRVREFAGEV